MPTTLSIDSVHREGALVLVVDGELDIATAHLLDEALARAQSTDAPRIIVDLVGVRFMDSMGLHVVLKHAGEQECRPRVLLTRGSRQVQRLFELTGALDHLPFEPA